MIQLTESLQQAVDAAPNRPVELVDPRSNRVYLLLPAEGFNAQPEDDLDAIDMPTVSLLVDSVFQDDDERDPHLPRDRR